MAKTYRRESTKNATTYYPTKRARKIEKRRTRQETKRSLRAFG